MKPVAIIRETNTGNLQYTVEDHFFNSRTLFLTEDVNPENTNELIRRFLYLDQTSPGKEITFFISSPGGSVNAGLCLYNVIRMLRSPVRTICTGTAASMGAILFLSGSTRLMLPDAMLMIHDPSTYFEEGFTTTQDVKERLESLMHVRERLCSIIAERTGSTIQSIYKKTARDTWYDAPNAIKAGLATGIWEQLPA